MTDVESTEQVATAVDPGILRAGMAAAARRRELNISQRRLAAEGIINAGALIAFEKGRSWPRERTRARLEEVLRWSPGTIARLREEGQPAPAGAPAPGGAAGVDADEVPLVAQAVLAAVHGIETAVAALPDTDAPDFGRRVAAVLADLRRLEAVASRAARINRVSPPLIKALGTVRRTIDELTMRAAGAPGATLGQRLYAARRRANLTVEETAAAAGVADGVIMAAEAEQPVAADAARAIEHLLEHLD